MAILPVIHGTTTKQPLVKQVGGVWLPMVAADPCGCCDDCYGCVFPPTMTCTISGFAALGLPCAQFGGGRLANCGGWNKSFALTLQGPPQSGDMCVALYTGIALHDPCAGFPNSVERNVAATALFRYFPATNTHSYSVGADAGRWHGEIVVSSVPGCPQFIYAFPLTPQDGSICTGSPIAAFA